MRWSSLKAVSVLTSVIGGLRGCTAISALVCFERLAKVALDWEDVWVGARASLRGSGDELARAFVEAATSSRESSWKRRRARESRALNLTLSFVLWFLALSLLSIRPGLENLNRVFNQMEAKQRELQGKFACFEVFAELSRNCNVSTNVSLLKATHTS